MRVIHLIGGGDTGGAKTHVLHLLKDLNAHIDAELYCFMKGEFSEEATQMGIPIQVIDSRNPISGIKQLRKRIGNRPVDLIHCHGARGNLMGTLLKRFVKAPVVTTVHSDYRLDYLGRPAARLSYGTTYTIALRKVNYYIGVSDPMTDILIDRNFPADRIYTIYNGIDFKTPLQYCSREAFYQSIGFSVSPGDVVAGIAARLSPVKDIPTLLKAMAIALKETPHLKLIIAGDGEDAEALQQLAKTLHIEEHVCFAGWLSDINSFYNALDINLLTSISETFPYALTEGTRMHCATIASRVGGIPVLIDDGQNGFIFEPGDIETLAARLVTLTKDETLRKEMGDRLYEKSARLFSIDSMVETQLGIYESILQRDRRAKSRKRDGIVICGAYGYGNAGDDAILKSIIGSVKQLDPEMPITILAKNTRSVKKNFRANAIHTFHFWKMFLSMRRSLLYINGGGSLIQNVTSGRSLYYYLLTLRLAKLCKNKVIMYGCGIGPVNGGFSMRLVMKVLNRAVDVITLREEHSLKELQRFGVTKPEIHVTSDPALVLTPVSETVSSLHLQKSGLQPDGSYVCFLLRNWYGFHRKASDIAACANHLYHTHGLTPVFIAMNMLSDEDAAQPVIEQLRVPYHIVPGQGDPQLMMGLLSHMKLVVAMRLHGLIFASASGIPLVGISYDPKINSFLDYLGYGSCLELDTLTAEALIDAAQHSLTSENDRGANREKYDALARKERINIETVARLLLQITPQPDRDAKF